jgi:hypothetical protein
VQGVQGGRGGRPVIESSSNYYFISKYLLTIKGIARRERREEEEENEEGGVGNLTLLLE